MLDPLGLSICPVVPARRPSRSDPGDYCACQHCMRGARENHLPSDLNGIELHAHCENSSLLCVVCLRASPHHGAEVEVLHLLLVLVDEVAPPLLAGLALHLVLVYGGGCVEVGELLLEVLVDLIVNLGEAQSRALDLFEDVPVRLHVLDNCVSR